jgi:beta-aspartyl-peptidase (threonine type)
MITIKKWKPGGGVLGLLLSLVFVPLTIAQTTVSGSNELRQPPETQEPAETVAQEIAVIKGILADQEKSWNSQDIERFMAGYWRSDEMTFAGGGEVVRGWQATLDRYRKNYPPEKMGTLDFRNLEVRLIGASAAMVLGNYHLEIQGETKQGGFTLVLQKFDFGWRIIHDHSSASPVKPTTPAKPDDK